MKTMTKRCMSAALAMFTAISAHALVSEQEAARLGADLTPMGAERAGNAEGTIPAWAGTMKSAPEDLVYSGDGSPLPDPYAFEKPLFSITAENVEQHTGKLTAGQIELFKLYPDSYRMDIYPTHRDAGYSQIEVERAKWNATRTQLTNNGESIENWTGGTAFPVPQNGLEVMWNTRTGGIPSPTVYGRYVQQAVYANGSRSLNVSSINTNFVFADRSNPVGTTEKQLGKILFKNLSVQLMPQTEMGVVNLIFDPIDYSTTGRESWRYNPGTRRVRQTPDFRFDTPTGPGGMITIDDTNGFNGTFELYDWKLVGKREMYIPYHNYAFDDSTLDFNTLLPLHHANPNMVRYELHRVWVVEATMKGGARHLYGRRVFYIDEDSWLMVAIDNYDRRGEIYRTGLIHSVYNYAVQGYVNRAQLWYDLHSGNYLASRLVNRTSQPILNGKMKEDKFYSADNLPRMSRHAQTAQRKSDQIASLDN